jgi:hypothetical protein
MHHPNESVSTIVVQLGSNVHRIRAVVNSSFSRMKLSLASTVHLKAKSFFTRSEISRTISEYCKINF